MSLRGPGLRGLGFRKLGLGVLLLLGLGLLTLGGLIAWKSQPRPELVEGPEAEALAQTLLGAVDAGAWARTGAVAWTFSGRNTHLWDRERHLARVRWGESEALVDLNTQRGVALHGGEPLTGRAGERAVARAYAAWVNDAFWLAAPTKVLDPGTLRGVQTLPDGQRRLAVWYTSGGLTPGDLYVWHLDPQGRPTAWGLWVSILPIGGQEATWEGWTQLETGAWVSTLHRLGPLTVELTGVRGATHLAELETPDPFAALLPLPSP